MDIKKPQLVKVEAFVHFSFNHRQEWFCDTHRTIRKYA